MSLTSPRISSEKAWAIENVEPPPIDTSLERSTANVKCRFASVDWNKTAIAAAIKETITAHGIKMPQLAHAVRVLVCGRTQTPSIDAVLELFTRETVLARLPGV